MRACTPPHIEFKKLLDTILEVKEVKEVDEVRTSRTAELANKNTRYAKGDTRDSVARTVEAMDRHPGGLWTER